MKRILCFGDSNTFGYIPAERGRYPKDVRWSGILSTLGDGKFKIIEAGCNNRTCFCDNPVGLMQTGYKILASFLEENLDGIILAIGINDTQTHYGAKLEEFKTGLENLIKIARTGAKEAKIIIAAPAQLSAGIFKDEYFSTLFDKSSIEKSLHLGEIYETVSREQNCYFIDWNKLVKVSDKDGLHLETEAHKIIAEKTYELLNSIY